MNDYMFSILSDRHFSPFPPLSPQFFFYAGNSFGVYSRMKNQDLNKLVKLENGKKLINTKALELFNKSSSQSSFNQVEQGLESTEREYIESLKKQIEELQRDKQELYRLLDQQQQLTAQANATIKLLQAPKEEASVIQQEKQEQKKQGFFARLFSRDN